MELTIPQLLDGKSTVIKNVEFFPTKMYVEPFLEKMSKFTDNFMVQAITPDQMSVTKDNKDIVYNRVWIQAVMPETHLVDNHDEVYGLVYGLNAKKPVFKLYKGGLNRACTNLCVFDPSWLNTQEILPGETMNFNPLMELIEKENDLRVNLERMKNEYLIREDHRHHLGKWMNYVMTNQDNRPYGKIQIAESIPSKAYKQLFLDSEHKYYIPEGINPTKFDVYSAFTDLISHDKRDILSVAEKTLMLNELINVD